MSIALNDRIHREHFEITVFNWTLHLHSFRLFLFIFSFYIWQIQSLHKRKVCRTEMFLVSRGSVCVRSRNPTFQWMLILIVLHLRALFKMLGALSELILDRWSYLLPVWINPFARFLAGQHTKLILWSKSPGAITSVCRLSSPPTGPKRARVASRFILNHLHS